MSRARTAGLLAVLGVLAFPILGTASDPGPNPITGISVREEAHETVITISAERTPTFSVFKLEDPVRLFVDVPQGDVSKVSDPIVVDNGVVEQVGTLQFRSHGVPVGRIILGLRQDVPYDVKTSDGTLVVRIDGRNRRPGGGEVAALAGKAADLRESVKREQELLAQLQAARARDEALRASEETSRLEAERLRAEALRLKDAAEREAAEAQAVARTETDRVRALKDESAAQQAKLAEADDAAKIAVARRAAEEDAARKAEDARQAAQAALKAEQDRLAAVREAREAEEAHSAAVQALAIQEKEGLAQARAARAKEEKLLAQLETAKVDAARAKDAGESRELSTMKGRVADLEKAIADARAQEKARVRTVDDRHAVAAKALKASEAQLAQARTASAKLEKRVKELQADREVQAARAAKADVEAKRLAAVATGDREAAKAQYQDAMTRLAREEQRLKDLAAERTTQERRIAELKSGYEAALAQARAESRNKDATIRDLSDQVARARQEVVKARETADAQAGAVADLKAALRKEQAGRADAGEVARLKAALQQKETTLAQAKADIEQRLVEADELNKRRAAEVERLSAEVERLKGERARSEGAQASQVQDLKGKLDSREAELTALRRAYDDARRGLQGRADDQGRVAKLKSRLDTQQAEMAELKAAYEAERDGGKAAVAEREKRIAALTSQLAALKAADAAKESREVQRLRDQVASREAVLARTQDELARAKSQGSKKASEAKAAGERVDAARKALAQTKTEMSAARERERAAQEREAKAAARAEELMAQLGRTGRELEGARAEAAELAQRLSSKEAEVERLSASLKQSRSAAEAAELEQRLSAREAEVERLSASLKEARAAAETRPAPQAVAAAPAAAPRATPVRSIDFQEQQGTPAVIVHVDGRPEYQVAPAGDRRYVLTLTGASLPADLARRMDVTAFESTVTMVSSYSAQDGTVRLVVDLAEPTGQSVQMKDGKLLWTFGGPASSRLMAGAAPTPTAVPRNRMLAMNAPQAEGGAAPAAAPAAAPSPAVPAMAAPAEGGNGEYLKPTMVPKKKKYRGKHINLTVKDADIQNVLTFLAREGKVNIVTAEEVRGKVTFHLEDVPWDLALDTVLKAKGMDYVVEQGIYRVAPVEALQKEYDARIEMQKKQRELKPLVVRLIPINYGDGPEMLNRVRSVLSPKGKAEVDLRTNTLVVTDTEDYLVAAEDLVRRLDQQTPQILIEARIVEARTTFKEDIGIQWGGRFAMASAFGNETGLIFPSSVGIMGGDPSTGEPKGGITLDQPHWAVNLPAAVGQGSGGSIGIQLGSIGGAANLSLRLSAAEENGDVKIISSPRVSTLDNRKASISQGVSIPISVVSAAGVNTQFFAADLRLEVLPHVTRDGHINMKLDITKNEPDFGNVAANGNPTIQKKEAHTELLIKDGDTTVIGGIYTRSTSKSYKKVPLLGDIPVLGWLFKSRSENDTRSELLIFITPKVVNREVAL